MIMIFESPKVRDDMLTMHVTKVCEDVTKEYLNSGPSPNLQRFEKVKSVKHQ